MNRLLIESSKFKNDLEYSKSKFCFNLKNAKKFKSNNAIFYLDNEDRVLAFNDIEKKCLYLHFYSFVSFFYLVQPYIITPEINTVIKNLLKKYFDMSEYDFDSFETLEYFPKDKLFNNLIKI